MCARSLGGTGGDPHAAHLLLGRHLCCVPAGERIAAGRRTARIKQFIHAVLSWAWYSTPSHICKPATISFQVLNKVGAVGKHPDCQFGEVIAASRGTLLTLAPWQAPVAVSRVWCLFEVMKTLQAGTQLSLVPDRSFWEEATPVGRR